MELTEFLLARIAEDEAVALDAAKYVKGGGYIEIVLTLTDREAGESHSKRIRPWQPERALAECEAKRRIVEDYLLRDEQGQAPGGEVFGYHGTGMKQAIRRLASVYADHPDYREEWKP